MLKKILKPLANNLFSIRFFQKASLKPHDKNYLEQQLQSLLNAGKDATLIDLKKGHRLVGAIINNDHFLHDVAVYEPKTLAHLSSEETEALQKRCQQNASGFGHMELAQDVSCVQIKTSLGHPFYYISPFMLHYDLKKLGALETFISKESRCNLQKNEPSVLELS